MPQSGVGQFVADTASDRNGDDETAIAQARKVIRESAPGHTDRLGQIRGVRRPVVQSHQQLAADRIGEGTSEPGERIGVGSGGQHPTRVQPLLNSDPICTAAMGVTTPPDTLSLLMVRRDTCFPNDM